MKKTFYILLWIISFLLGVPLLLNAKNYYIDAIDGKDINTGLSVNEAWQNLSKINSFTFQPGDSILLKAGCIWTGNLSPNGSGAKNHAIIIDKYGKGNNPVLDGNGSISNGVLYFHNVSFWEVNNLEITNNNLSEGDRRGVLILADISGLWEHFHLKNLYIHDIKGMTGGSVSAKNTGGIIILNHAATGVSSRFNDIVIENCEIKKVDNTGIGNRSGTSTPVPGTADWENRKFTGVIIRNNTIHDIGKNAIITVGMDSSCLIERNVCFETAMRSGTGNTIFTYCCNGTIFQYNEGYNNRSTDFDGSLYDADSHSPNCVFQYSYSHNNHHGLFWVCTDTSDSGIIVRYNISQDDSGYIFNFGAPNYQYTSINVYNNVIFISPNTSPTIINGWKKGRTFFYNNIIYNLSSTSRYRYYSEGGPTDTKSGVNSNVFYGFHPTGEPPDSNKLIVDPLFVDPGKGYKGISTLSGYILKSSSPCINSGLLVENKGERDFWGNHLYNGNPDRGAYEYPDTIIVTKTFKDYKNDRLNEFIVYPNPATEIINIAFSSDSENIMNVEFYDLSGKMILTIQKKIYQKNNIIQITTSNLPEGLYIIKINVDNKISIWKIMISR